VGPSIDYSQGQPKIKSLKRDPRQGLSNLGVSTLTGGIVPGAMQVSFGLAGTSALGKHQAPKAVELGALLPKPACPFQRLGRLIDPVSLPGQVGLKQVRFCSIGTSREPASKRRIRLIKAFSRQSGSNLGGSRAVGSCQQAAFGKNQEGYHRNQHQRRHKQTRSQEQHFQPLSIGRHVRDLSSCSARPSPTSVGRPSRTGRNRQPAPDLKSVRLRANGKQAPTIVSSNRAITSAIRCVSQLIESRSSRQRCSVRGSPRYSVLRGDPSSRCFRRADRSQARSSVMALQRLNSGKSRVTALRRIPVSKALFADFISLRRGSRYHVARPTLRNFSN